MLHIKMYQVYVRTELLSLLRIYGKSATSAQTDGRIATDGPLYTGNIVLKIFFFTNHAESELGRLVRDLFLFFKKAFYEVKANDQHFIFNIFWRSQIYVQL